MTSNELIRTVAHHEAGHAAICFLLYGEQVIKSVEVFQGNAVSGRTTTYSRLPIPIVCRPPIGAPRRGNPAPVSADAIVDAHGVLNYAGIAAEGLLVSDSSPAVWTRIEQAGEPAARGWADREALAELANTVGASRPAEHFFREYWEEARRLLRLHWRGVDALSEVLVEHGKLHGDRVDAVLLASRYG